MSHPTSGQVQIGSSAATFVGIAGAFHARQQFGATKLPAAVTGRDGIRFCHDAFDNAGRECRDELKPRVRKASSSPRPLLSSRVSKGNAEIGVAGALTALSRSV